MDDYKTEAEKVYNDPCASYWLKEAVRIQLRRDPLDAANDAKHLLAILEMRVTILLGSKS